MGSVPSTLPFMVGGKGDRQTHVRRVISVDTSPLTKKFTIITDTNKNRFFLKISFFFSNIRSSRSPHIFASFILLMRASNMSLTIVPTSVVLTVSV